ncbi:MAG: protein sorting system archaetidylserine synthase [Halodesulfurarchaeum sp.]
MGPRVLRALTLPDVVTTTNAVLGFFAVVAAMHDVSLAARLILLAAIFDAVDGILARRYGGSAVGSYLDSLADVASFGVAPATMMVVASPNEPAWLSWGAVALGGIFVGSAVVRLGLYTAYDTDQAATKGVQTTLAATILSAGLLAGVPETVLVGSLGVFAVLMVGEWRYPDLRVRDALLMGGIQAGAIVGPGVLWGVFPRALLAWALAYLLLAPGFYGGAEGKRS